MYLNQFEQSNAARLNQILHTLQAVHGIKLTFDWTSPTVKNELLETKQTYERIKYKIIQESSFNSYQQNPEYTKSMLILEAVRIILKEIAPKRRRHKKVKESQDAINENLVDTFGTKEHEIRIFKDGRANNYKIKVYKNNVHDPKFDAVTDTEDEAREVADDRMKTKTEGLTIMSAHSGYASSKPGMDNVHETGISKEISENKGMQMTANRTRILENALHQQHDYEYQASMARSELYRNAKYAMSMLKQIDPHGEVPPWIAGALTKSANYLDKIFHYLDYYKKFEPEKLPENIDQDMELGETSGGVTRENLMLVVEYSIKLFNMIQPGDKLEGWVAMKLTTASENISSCKHYLDYVQFEQHGLDSHFDDGRRAIKRNMEESLILEEVETAEDLQRAKTIISSKEMSDEVQKIAEKTAQLSVERLMELVDSMRTQFGVDVANGFNGVVKGALEELLNTATKTKENIDEAIATLQAGGVPGTSSDIENVGAPDTGPTTPPGDELAGAPAGSEPAGKAEEPLGRAKKEVSEARFEFDKKTGGMKLNKEDPDQRHGLYGADGKLMRATNTKDEAENLKKRDPKFKTATIKKIAEAKKLDEKWGTKMHTADKDKGKWDGYTISELKSKKATLMKKEKRSAAEQKTVKQIDFAIRAKQKNKWGKVKESVQINEKSPPGKKAEKWIKSNKKRFIDQYGKKKGLSVLYAKAWDMFGESKETYLKVKTIVETKQKMINNLQNQLAVHKTHFAESVATGNLKDPLSVGYGLEGEILVQKINTIQKELNEASSVMSFEMKKGVKHLMEQLQNLNKVNNLLKVKDTTPYGVIYTRGSKPSKKMFENAETRDYWLGLNSDEITDVKMIEPETFEKAIDSVLKGN